MNSAVRYCVTQKEGTDHKPIQDPVYTCDVMQHKIFPCTVNQTNQLFLEDIIY